MNKYYTRIAIDHFLHPRNAREIADATGIGEAVNKAGDTVRFYLMLDGERVVDAAFKAQGCAATIAAASVATELLAGKTTEEVKTLEIGQLDQALGGLPPFKVERAHVVISAIQAALEDARQA